MNRVVFFIGCCVLLIVFAVNLSSCHVRDETNPPGVGFLYETGSVADDTTLPAYSIATIYVYANKLGVIDMLDSGTIQYSLNGRPDSVIQTMHFNSTTFTQYYSYQLGDSGNSYKFVFTFFNQNNVGGSDSLTVTTN